MNKVKRFLIGATAGAVMFGSLVIPAFAAVPPGPPAPAEVGCPGRSDVDLDGPQATQPDLNKMANGECPVPTGNVPPTP